MKKNITSIDIAKLAKVSQSTVSRAFVPGAYINKQKKEHVLHIANKLGYRPSALAASLAGRSSKIICLVVGHLGNLFYSHVVEGIARRLREEGYAVLLFFNDEYEKNAEEVLAEILRYKVDGIVMAASSITSDFAMRCHQQKIPVVLLNGKDKKGVCNTVITGNFMGGEMVAEHFSKLGHIKVAFLAGNANSITSADRRDGFLAGIKSYGLQLTAMGTGNFNGDKTEEEFMRMRSKGNFSAIFVANDFMAFRVLEMARHVLHLRVPEDLAVVGHDDDPMSAWPSFSLTTVGQNAVAMAEKSVALLLKQVQKKLLNEEMAVQHEVLTSKLIVRNSTKLIKTSKR